MVQKSDEMNSSSIVVNSAGRVLDTYRALVICHVCFIALVIYTATSFGADIATPLPNQSIKQYLKETVDRLRRAGTPEEKCEALNRIAKLKGYGAATLDDVCKHTRSESSIVRSAAIYTLAQIAGGEPRVAQIIATRLDDVDPLVRVDCVRALSSMGANDSAVVDAFVKGTRDEWEVVRIHSVAGLTKTHENSTKVKEALRGLHEDSVFVRVQVAAAEWALFGARDSLEQLVDFVASDDPDVCLAAMSAIGHAGIDAVPAIEAVGRVAVHGKVRERRAAVTTLAHTPAAEALQYLATCMSDTDSGVRLGAVGAVRQRADKHLVPKAAVEGLVGDEDEVVALLGAVFVLDTYGEDVDALRTVQRVAVSENSALALEARAWLRAYRKTNSSD